MNKYLFSLALFIMPGAGAVSQDWSPINTLWKHHFRIDTVDHITHTVYVDSITVSGNDSIFHLNRIMLACDTCGDPWNLYMWKNQPQFLQQRMVRKPGETYRFEDKDVFYLRPAENIGASWIYDSVSVITAIVDDIYLGDVLGTTDSLKRVLLSTGDTLLLSKNYGIIRFPSSDGYNYHLEGIGGAGLGMQVPGFNEFYDFEVGDVFQYLWETNYLGDGSHILTKSTILEKTDYGDSLVYEVHNKGFNWQTAYPGYPHDTVYFDEFTQWRFIDSAGHFCNRFNQEAAISVPPFWGPVFCEVDLVWEAGSQVRKKIRANPSVGQGLGWQLMNPSNPMYHPDLLIPAVDGYELEYRQGLGEVYYYFWVFEVTEWEELIGYVKDGDTTGKVYEDSLLTFIPNKSLPEVKFSISPNPARDHVTIAMLDSNAFPSRVSIFNQQGQLMAYYEIRSKEMNGKLDISKLAPGIYVVDVRRGEYRNFMKLVVCR